MRMDAMTFDYPLLAGHPPRLTRGRRIPTVPSTLSGSSRTAVCGVLEGLRPGEPYLGSWALRGRLKLLMFYDGREFEFGGDMVNVWLCEFRDLEAVSTLPCPGEAKDEEGVVRLLQRSHDGRTGRLIRDRRDSRVEGHMECSRSGNTRRTQCTRRCGVRVPIRTDWSTGKGGERMTSLYGHPVDRSVSRTILTC